MVEAIMASYYVYKAEYGTAVFCFLAALFAIGKSVC
jgi:hypothetical protein